MLYKTSMDKLQKFAGPSPSLTLIGTNAGWYVSPAEEHKSSERAEAFADVTWEIPAPTKWREQYADPGSEPDMSPQQFRWLYTFRNGQGETSWHTPDNGNWNYEEQTYPKDLAEMMPGIDIQALGAQARQLIQQNHPEWMREMEEYVNNMTEQDQMMYSQQQFYGGDR